MKNLVNSKRIIAIVACVLISSVSVLAQTVKKHIVERGETVESIAEKYGVTKASIIEINPDAAQFVYVGMELKIPEGGKIVEESKNVISTPISTFNDNVNESDVHLDESRKGTFKTRIMAGLSVNKWVGKDVESFFEKDGNSSASNEIKTNLGFHVGLYGDYYISNTIFTGAGIMFNTKGYKADEKQFSGESWDDEGANYDNSIDVKMITYNIDIPIYIGGRFDIGLDKSFYLKGGPYLTYALSGKRTRKGTNVFYDTVHSSEIEHINEKIDIGKGELKDYQKFGVGLMGTVGFTYSNIFFEVSFQRGLTKLIKKNKMFEQNIMFSIGYEL